MKKEEGKSRKKWTAEKSEEAMIQGILEGSPEAIGVAVVRLDCGCRKMAAVSSAGEPASKLIMYRDQAESVCDQCKKDNGDFMRVTEQFISWKEPAPEDSLKPLLRRTWGWPSISPSPSWELWVKPK